MTLARTLAPALALAAACASSPAPVATKAPEAPASGPEDLVAISRAMTAIEASELKGDIAAERQQRSAAASSQPGDVVARFLALYALPRDEESWSAFRALAEQHPDSAWGHLGMVRIYLSWDTLDQADAEIVRSLSLAPGNWIALLFRGQLSERQDKVAEARADYDDVLRSDPANPEAHLGLARILRRAGDAEGAYREAQAALAAVPNGHAALALLGRLSLDLGDRKQAAAYLQAAAASSPRDHDDRVALAKLLQEMGDDKGAIAQWRAALSLKDYLAGWKALAQLARNGGEVEIELRAVQRITLLEPANVDAWRRLAELKLARDPAGAEQALGKVLDRDPEDAQAHRLLGHILESRGEVLTALENYREAGDAARGERASLERRLNVERVAKGDLKGLQRAVGGLINQTYRARLRETPRLAGTLSFRVSVDKGGQAVLVEVLEDSVHDDWVRASAYWNLRDASYPKGKPGRHSFRFALRPGR
jgi:tetratricopeptide (TPR) repeat protein